jgi:dTDP-L-rhamnose 4-epimerase
VKVFITGVAGFIGSTVAELLESDGHEVRGIDRLVEQVHPSGDWPSYLDCERYMVDIRDVNDDVISTCDSVIHLAARVGVGQSADNPLDYVDENVWGTVKVMQAAVDAGVKRVVVASSMSVYGEGLPTRGLNEDHPTNPRSVYATTKLASEQVALQLGRVYGLDVIALRLFNVYGRRQTISNPYTGLGAIFSRQILEGERPTVFEDGLQLRDFVHVSDVARACVLALESGESDLVVNIGTGIPTSVLSFAHILCDAHGSEMRPQVTGHVREGDVRFCYADIAFAKEILGYEPRVMLEEGLTDLVEWTAQRDHA